MKSVRPGEGEGPVRLDPDTVLSARVVGAGAARGGGWAGRGRPRHGSGLGHRQRLLSGAALRPSCRARAGHRLLHILNVAIAALYARKTYGVERVAVVDFDVHHGNGTQDIFWSDEDLLFASTHQMPLYPGTGAVSETGVGNIWNAPLRPATAATASRKPSKLGSYRRCTTSLPIWC